MGQFPDFLDDIKFLGFSELIIVKRMYAEPVGPFDSVGGGPDGGGSCARLR